MKKKPPKPIECWAPLDGDGELRRPGSRLDLRRSKPPTPRELSEAGWNAMTEFCRVRITPIRDAKKAKKGAKRK